MCLTYDTKVFIHSFHRFIELLASAYYNCHMHGTHSLTSIGFLQTDYRPLSVHVRLNLFAYTAVSMDLAVSKITFFTLKKIIVSKRQSCCVRKVY